MAQKASTVYSGSLQKMFLNPCCRAEPLKMWSNQSLSTNAFWSRTKSEVRSKCLKTSIMIWLPMIFKRKVGGLSLLSGVQTLLCVAELPALSRAKDESHRIGLRLGDTSGGIKTASAPQLAWAALLYHNSIVWLWNSFTHSTVGRNLYCFQFQLTLLICSANFLKKMMNINPSGKKTKTNPADWNKFWHTTYVLFFFSFFSSTTLLLPTHLPPPSCIHAQSCNSMDCSLPGSSVHGLFQARILEWVAISFSTQHLCHGLVVFV